MQTWEYAIAYCRYDWTKSKWDYTCGKKAYDYKGDMLKDLGDEGWELVSVTTYISSEFGAAATDKEIFYFKRRGRELV